MGATKSKKKNKNEYKKVYPYIRRRPVFTYELDKETIIETICIEFTIVFSGDYTVPPTVTASVCGTEINLNVIIQNITISGCTVMLSDVPGIETTVSYIAFGE